MFCALTLSRKALADGVSELPLRRFLVVCCSEFATIGVWLNFPMAWGVYDLLSPQYAFALLPRSPSS